MTKEPFMEASEVKSSLLKASEEYIGSASRSRGQLYVALREAYRWQRLAQKSEPHAEEADKLIADRLGDVKEKKIREAKTFVSIIKATVLYEPQTNQPKLFNNVDQMATTYSRALEWCNEQGYTSEKTEDALISHGVVALKEKLYESTTGRKKKKRIGLDPKELIEELPSIADFHSDHVADYGDGMGIFLGRIVENNVSIVRQLPSLQDKVMEAVNEVLLKDALANSAIGLFILPINLANRFVGPLKTLQLQFVQRSYGITLTIKSRVKHKWAQAVLFESRLVLDQINDGINYSLGHEAIQKIGALYELNENPFKWSIAQNSLRIGPTKIRLNVKHTYFSNKNLRPPNDNWTRDVYITRRDWLSLVPELKRQNVNKCTATILAEKINFGNGVSVDHSPSRSDEGSRKKVSFDIDPKMIRHLGRAMNELEAPSLQIQATKDLARFSIPTPAGTFGIVV